MIIVKPKLRKIYGKPLFFTYSVLAQNVAGSNPVIHPIL